MIAREFNHQLRVVQRHELSAEIGSNIYYGGMVDEVSAGLNPARYVAGLGRAAMKAGAEVFEHTRVESLRRESRHGEAGWKITTSRGTLWAREVFRRHQRLHRQGNSCAAEETHPHRVVHYYNPTPE